MNKHLCPNPKPCPKCGACNCVYTSATELCLCAFCMVPLWHRNGILTAVSDEELKALSPEELLLLVLMESGFRKIQAATNATL